MAASSDITFFEDDGPSGPHDTGSFTSDGGQHSASRRGPHRASGRPDHCCWCEAEEGGERIIWNMRKRRGWGEEDKSEGEQEEDPPPRSSARRKPVESWAAARETSDVSEGRQSLQDGGSERVKVVQEKRV